MTYTHDRANEETLAKLLAQAWKITPEQRLLSKEKAMNY